MPPAPLDRRMTHRLRLRHLELIAAIHDHGGILKASQHLNLTQPAVTKSLHVFRARWFDRFANRSSRSAVHQPRIRRSLPRGVMRRYCQRTATKRGGESL